MKTSLSLVMALLSFLALPARAADATTGDLHLSYHFAPTGDEMPYRLYVPSGYDGKKAMPLVVVLHGWGESEGDMFDRPGGATLKQLAQQRGYIVLAPHGYSRAGGFGSIYPVVVTRETAREGAALVAMRTHPAAPGTPQPPRPARPPLVDVAVPADDYVDQPKGELSDAHANELSEEDVMAAIQDVRTRFSVDASRIYLVGNSMGGSGAAYLAVKYAPLWAAVAPAGGPVAAWSYPFGRLHANRVPILFVHGEFDEHSNPHWSRVLADDARAEGVDAQFLLVKGGHHGDAWITALSQIFDFFDEHRRH